MAIEYIYKAIQNYTIKQPSTVIIGADTTKSTIFNHDAFPNDLKYGYLYKGNPHILITGAKMKHFNTGIPDPSYPNVDTMMTPE